MGKRKEIEMNEDYKNFDKYIIKKVVTFATFGRNNNFNFYIKSMALINSWIVLWVYMSSVKS